MVKIYQWKDYHKTKNIHSKVCIIGSGCGGATLAKELQSFGIDTIIIEKGGYYPTASFDNWELNMAAKISAERNLQMDNNYSMNLVYGNNIGGASVHYWADSYRTPEDRLSLWEGNKRVVIALDGKKTRKQMIDLLKKQAILNICCR